MKRILALLAATMLAGCQNSQTLKEIGNAPAMSPIGSGLQYGQTQQMSLYPKQPRHAASGYSLWSDSQAALFKDARAINIGDIMTVKISINDKASFDNETDRSRTNSTSLTWGANVKNILGFNTDTGTSADLGTDSSTDSVIRAGMNCGMNAITRERSCADICIRSSVRNRAAPDAGTRPARARNSVVLPAPFGPTNAVTCPAAIGGSVRPLSTFRAP